MRFAIIGAGSIGGWIGARLLHSGQEVALVARGAHLVAMRENGLRVTGPKDDLLVHPLCVSDPEEIGPVDVVIISLKAHQLPPFALKIPPLLGPNTLVVSAMNGLPWWYFQRHGGPLDGLRLEALDPAGNIERVIAPERIIGCEVLPSAEIVEPGVIRHISGNTLPLGEPDGSLSPRIQALAEVFTAAGFKSPVSPHIRKDIWIKLMGNVAFNPISTLTRATLVEMAEHPQVKEVVRQIMMEVIALCARLGMDIDISPERRIEGARKVGAHKTSMLQDLEAGKPLELECMVGAVLELGKHLDISMPHTQALYALTHLLVNRADPKTMAA